MSIRLVDGLNVTELARAIGDFAACVRSDYPLGPICPVTRSRSPTVAAVARIRRTDHQSIPVRRAASELPEWERALIDVFVSAEIG